LMAGLVSVAATELKLEIWLAAAEEAFAALAVRATLAALAWEERSESCLLIALI
jgi:hypothetical protein